MCESSPIYTVEKVIDFLVPMRVVTDQTLTGREKVKMYKKINFRLIFKQKLSGLNFLFN